MRDEAGVVAGGAAATGGLLAVLFAGDALSGYRVHSFRALAEFVSAQTSPLVGLLLFAGIGVFAWPLVYLSLLAYFPGQSDVARGVVFAVPLWVGYPVVFSRESPNLLLFLAVMLLAHVVYGTLLGLVYARLGAHEVGDV